MNHLLPPRAPSPHCSGGVLLPFGLETLRRRSQLEAPEPSRGHGNRVEPPLSHHLPPGSPAAPHLLQLQATVEQEQEPLKRQREGKLTSVCVLISVEISAVSSQGGDLTPFAARLQHKRFLQRPGMSRHLRCQGRRAGTRQEPRGMCYRSFWEIN